MKLLKSNSLKYCTAVGRLVDRSGRERKNGCFVFVSAISFRFSGLLMETRTCVGGRIVSRHLTHNTSVTMGLATGHSSADCTALQLKQQLSPGGKHHTSASIDIRAPYLNFNNDIPPAQPYLQLNVSHRIARAVYFNCLKHCYSVPDIKVDRKCHFRNSHRARD